MSDVRQLIREHIQEEFAYDSDTKMVADDQSLIQAGIIDSLGIFLLIAFLEEKLGVKVDPEDVVIENFDNVDAITALVESKRTAA